MDLKGSLIDTNIRIYPSKSLLNFLETIPDDDLPLNISKLLKGKNYEPKENEDNCRDQKCINPIEIQLNDKDIENLNRIKETVKKIKKSDGTETGEDSVIKKNDAHKEEDSDEIPLLNNEGPCLTTSDIDWLYLYIEKRRNKCDKDVPYLHTLLEGAHIAMPENRMIKRNPILEARCVKLRAQQEAREYRKMTKTVDNVRMRFPEDSISYQLKQLNRQLIAIAQFLLSIFAGFLFGFRGVEWMVGNLDFGFRLLLGVMCALIIALAEIYFLAKKLNEELCIPETIQLGGPPKFAHEPSYVQKLRNAVIDKEHND